MKKRKVAFVFALAFLVLLQAAYGGGGSQAKSGGEVYAPDNDMVVGLFSDIQHLDPHNTSTTISNMVHATIYEALVRSTVDMKFEPLLAESWETSADNLSYTFHLRRGVKFHDGTEFNADVVLANYQRAEENTLSRQHSRQLTWDSVKKLDDYTVVIKLKAPNVSFINQVTSFRMISAKAIADKLDLARVAVGTGPFIFKERVEGDRVTMVPNPNYWDTRKPTVDSITFRNILEDGSRIAALQTGECDYIYRVPAIQVGVIDGKDNIEVVSKTSTVMRYVTLNTRIPQLSDKRVRQALNYAIDKKAYIKTVFSGYGTEVHSLFPSSVSYYVAQPPYDFNIAKAKSLLAEAGYPNGFDLEIWGDNTSTEQLAMQFVQQQLAQIGVKLNVRPMDSNLINSLIYVPDDQMTIQTWYVNWSGGGDVDGAVRNILYSAMKPPASANTAYYNSPKFDELLDQARATVDPAKLAPIYAEVQKVAWEDAPWIFMGSDDVIAGKKTYVSNVDLAPGGGIDFRFASLKLKP
ncbi:glutathione ABC transporter substrate-binding protein [Spirochaetia bacterium]|nr:glutathione ABC transporter substrate-binding protein [Spirochaetia bacterium]